MSGEPGSLVGAVSGVPQSLGRRYRIAEIVTGGLVLTVVASLHNAVSAIYLARRGRGAAVLSTALNSNVINVIAGQPDRPGAALGAGRAGRRVVCGLTVLALAWRGGGLSRRPGVVIIAGYLAFTAALVVTVAQHEERAFALLTQRWRTLQHITGSPSKIGDIACAALVLTHFEHGYTTSILPADLG